MRFATSVVVLVACGSSLLAADPPFKAGIAVKAITPDKPMWMAGYAGRTKPAEGKQHDLFAKALALEDAASKRLVIVTTDLIGIPRNIAEEVATAAEMKFGIKREDLMLTASHTHCGPVLRENLIDMYPLTPGEAEKVTAYTKAVTADLIEVIGNAVKKLDPVNLKFGQGQAAFAVNRRQATEKGVVIGTNPGGPVDHTVPVLVVEGADGKPRAVVFGYACHNTTLDFYQWCGDYAGFAQIGVEKAFPGAVAMFWTGCGADANPNPRRTLELCEKHGQELAEAVTKTVKGEMKPITGKFAAKFEKIPLKFDTLPTKAQLSADTLSKTLAVQKRAEKLLKQLEANGKLDDNYPHYPVQTWALGDQVRWVALGGEVVIDYAIRLKKELPPTRTLWVTGYANDVMAYIPSARVLKEGGYEADSSQIYYGMPAKWSPMIEDAIIGKVKELTTATGGIPPAPGPLSPKEELATIKVAPGFKVELVAAEPDIVDPVSMCFDEKGRMFVCEMRGYPNGGVGTGHETRGKIKCLTDKDGDGVFETCVTFAEGLRFPMGITPWKGGLLVAVAPDILYLEDTNGDGKADKTTVLYTGFNLANIQQMVNSLQWGLDNWIYGCAGLDGGVVKSAEKPGSPEVNLRNRGLRFKPWVSASLEPTSSGGQYGLTADDYQRWFTATNSQHLRQIVLPDHYLRRNPFFPVSAVTIDIPEHGAAAKVFRISPFEPWRVERTTRRAGGTDAKRFASTELVPGGYITSACSPLIYTADLFPEPYRGNNFVCDPANNLIHREVLVENGAVFTAKRVDVDCEFLASTDNWFRPVHLSIGPDGAMYVLDFYREVIETPLSLPDDIKKQLNLESRGRGRIWRIAPEGFKPTKLPDLSKAKPTELARHLVDPNPWVRLTAQRLLVERQAVEAVPSIRGRLANATGMPGVVNLLWTLHGLGELTADDVIPALGDLQAGTRENALRLAEGFFATSVELRTRAVKLTTDPSPRVRFQLAFSAGFLPADEAASVLGTMILNNMDDNWIPRAALIAAAGHELPVIDRLLGHRDYFPTIYLTNLASMVAARGKDDEIVQILKRVNGSASGTGRKVALVEGLWSGMRNAKVTFAAWQANPPAGAEPEVAKLRKLFEAAAAIVTDPMAPPERRSAAIGTLGLGPIDLAAPALAGLLTPATSNDLQLAAVRGLAEYRERKIADILLANWPTYSPAVKREVIDALAKRPEWVLAFLAAVEKKQVTAGDLGPTRVQQLKTHPNATVRAKAEAVLKASVNADRAKVIADYATALELKGDTGKGRGLFKQHCAACHKLDGVGNDVGMNLLAALPNKSAEDLLSALFDPNREVDPRYVNYQATTADGRVLDGVIVTETPTSVTLKRADGAEDTILRANLEALRSTKLSLMPEGFEKQLGKQDVADLFAYLRTAGK